MSCAHAATDHDRLLVRASHDLMCPAYRDETRTGPPPPGSRLGTPGTIEVHAVEAITIRQTHLGEWVASCEGRSARYRCVRGVCRRDEAELAATPWLAAGRFECRAVGSRIDASAAAAEAVARVGDELHACGVESVVLSVTPISGALALDTLPDGAPAGAERCVAVALLHADASPPPTEGFLMACRVMR